jgi:polyketide biosynthesis enoyl-CoA hydratase PksI
MTNSGRSPISLEVDAEGIAVLHMRDVEGKNAFSRGFVDQLMARFDELLADDRVKVCVIAGLDEVFCAGGDREVLLSLADGKVAPYDLKLTRALLEVPIPTIAAMAGPAVGGGLIFGLSCDVVVLGRESRYGCNFLDMGFTPGMGTTQLLQVAVGDYVAAEMMFGCQYFRGSHFEQRGNVNYVVPSASVMETSMKVAARFADKPRFALEMLKRTLSLPRRRAFEDARTIESLMHEICFSHPETAERIRENYRQTNGEEDES